MTDYFALLDQPRQPWLDPEGLKESFHARTRHSHPDARPESESDFAELNEAYQVLSDPKRRLHHLLALRGEAPKNAQTSVPSEIEAIFPEIAALTREADLLAEKLLLKTSTLSRSLLQSEVFDTQKKIARFLTTIGALRNKALVRLAEIEATDSAEMHALYLQFSYLNRWLQQLQEKQLHLTL
jgi:curved DNA-binding protein CbpA